jgi:tetratricopeptide (TPR) repeat protein
MSQFADLEIDIVEGLASLVDKSLLRLSENSTGEPHLRMLETIREYAHGKLQMDPDLHHAACRAHAAYFAEFTQRQWQRMAGYEREAALQALAGDVDNLQIAWGYWVAEKDMEKLQMMVDGLWLLYDGRGWSQATVELTRDLLAILSSTPSDPDRVNQEILLQTSLARALLAIKGYTSEVEEAYKRALTLSEGQGEIPQLFPVLRGLSSYYLYRTEYDKGAQVGRQILDLAESKNDDFLRVHGYLVLGANTGFLTGLQDGLEFLNKGIALFEREMQSSRPFQLGNNPGIVCYTTSAFFLWWLGLLESAVARANRAVELAKALDHPFTMAYALFHTSNLYMWRGEIKLAHEQAQDMLAIAEEHGFHIWEALAMMLIGASQTAMGQSDEGLPKVEDGFALYQGHISPPVFYPMLIGLRAVAFAQAGQPDTSLEQVEKMIQEFGEERMMREQTPLLLLKGDLLLAVSPHQASKAAHLYKAILASSEHVGGKLIALQAATRLCKLEMQDGQAQESGRVLAELYDSFTEGFETADLREAKAVLDRWRS